MKHLILCDNGWNKITLQCARGACALGMGLTRPFRHWTANQYSFLQGANNVLSMKTSTPDSLFAVETHDERVRVIDLDKSSRSNAQSLLACAAHLLILVRAYLHKGKRIGLVVLRRIMRKLVNIVCCPLKSCAAIT